MHTDDATRLEVEAHLNGLLGRCMRCFHHLAWLIGADTEKRGIEGTIGLADLAEDRAIGRITAEENVMMLTPYRKARPEGPIGVEAGTARPMDNGQRGDGDAAHFMPLMPVELNDIREAALAKEAPQPERHDHRHPALAGEPGKRPLVQMVVMIVAHRQNDDLGHCRDRHAGLHIAAGAETGRPRKGRQIWVGQHGESADAH